MLRRSDKYSAVELGSYQLFSANQGALLNLPNGRAYLKAGVLAPASAYPGVPSAFTGYMHPLAQVSEIGSGGAFAALAMDPGTGLPIILSDTYSGALVQMNAAQPARTLDQVRLNGATYLVGNSMPGMRYRALIVHKGRFAFSNDPSLSAYAGSTGVWSYPTTTASFDTISKQNTALAAGRAVVAFASNPAGNLVAINGASASNVAWYAPTVDTDATAAALPAMATWTGAAYGAAAGLFVAVASGTTGAASSPDGVTWTARAMPSAANWRAVAASSTGNKFVAVASGGTAAAYSTNGTAWTAATLPAAANWSAVAHNGTQWVAVARDSSIAATSSDGITWTQRALPATAGWSDVKWCAALGVWVAVADDGRAAAAYSADGISWTAKDLPRVADFTQLLGTGTATVYAVASYAGCPLIAKSTDSGATWTYYRPNIKIGASSSAHDTAMRYLNGALICASAKDATSIYLWRSTDGINWVQTTPTVPCEAISLQDLAYNGTAYVLVFQYTTSGTAHTICLTSADLVNWTQRAFTGSGACNWYSVIAAGTAFYALGGTGFPAFYLAKSVDNGVTWTSAAQNSSSQGINPKQGALYYDASRSAVACLHPQAAWSLLSLDGFTTSAYLPSLHASPYANSYAAAFFGAGAGGLWAAVGVSTIEVAPTRYGVPSAELLSYAYSSGYSLKPNIGKNSNWAGAAFPVDIGGVRHFTDGSRLLKLDSQPYIDNTHAASEASSYTTYGQLNYYMRVK